VAQVAEDFGAIHGLINNAGILRDGLLLKVKDGEMTKMSLAQWQAVIDVNLTGVFLCTREVAAKMVELKNSGAIINISSIPAPATSVRPTTRRQGRRCGGDRDLGQGTGALRHSCGRHCAGLHRNRNDPGHET
jgi:NAD(P)-dependent dehydrogenase (short-subunit alcohol dehydrogenase family)